ncbi:unnamed protein product [Arctogadus glacialis]
MTISCAVALRPLKGAWRLHRGSSGAPPPLLVALPARQEPTKGAGRLCGSISGAVSQVEIRVEMQVEIRVAGRIVKKSQTLQI